MGQWSSKKKRGRPKVERVPHDYGNARVQARAEMFRQIAGEKSRGIEMTCPGRLMLVGAFDGMEQEPAAYLAALLAYADGYWGNYGGGPRVATYERHERGHDSAWEDPRGEWFKAIDQRLRDAGHMARKAVHLVSVERHWFPDENAHFADAIINTRLIQRGVKVEFAILATQNDWDWLEHLKLGVRALVEPQQMRRAA